MSAPTAYSEAIAERILDGLMEGRTLTEICNDTGMPSTSTVRLWVAEDRDGFAARYRQVRDISPSPARGPTLYTTDIAERILNELAGGRTLIEVCDDDGMPGPGTVRQWATDNRDGFRARYQQARNIGHAKIGRTTLYTPELAERILAELREGRALRDVCRDDGMPTSGTVLHWEASDRDGFRARYRQARDIGYQIQGEELDEIAADGRYDYIERVNKDGSIERVLDREHVSRSRLQLEQGRWKLTNMLPRLYGKRVEVTATHEHGVSTALAKVMKIIDGWSRGLPGAEPEPLTLVKPEDESDE
jgi:hypothetical protein